MIVVDLVRIKVVDTFESFEPKMQPEDVRFKDNGDEGTVKYRLCGASFSKCDLPKKK
jgi:hypothetical protein